MLWWPTLAVALLTGPARPVSRASGAARASVRAATNVANVVADAPAGFAWVSMPVPLTLPASCSPSCQHAQGYDSSNPDAEIVEPPKTALERLDLRGYDRSTTTISEEEVQAAQANWVSAIKTISAVYFEGGDFVDTAATAAGELYGYGKTNVLFKPTKATDHPFRPTAEEAMSYFVGAEAMKNDEFKGEDAGFAINGGKGWKDVVFRNHQIELMGETAVAMGDYVFTDATWAAAATNPNPAPGPDPDPNPDPNSSPILIRSGDEVRVEYTFGYRKNDDGKVRIYLHHSSVPYSVAPAGPKPITEEEVEIAQQLWADSIASISKVDRTPKPKPKPKPKFTLTLTLTRGRARALTLPLALTRCTSTAATTSRRPARRRASCTATATATCSSASPNPSPRPTRALTLTRTLA